MISTPLGSELAHQRAAWSRRPLVRSLYLDWFDRMAEQMASGPGPSAEIGAGIGTLSEHIPGVIPTDVEETPWASDVVDAQALPYADGTMANLIGVDVLHHLPRPARFLGEAQRVLRPGGRVVLLEPYGSPVAAASWRFLHHEDYDGGADPLSEQGHSSDRPLDANVALPTLLFFRNADRLSDAFPKLPVVHRERLAMLAYPLSGGFGRRALVPDPVGRALMRLEKAMRPLAPLLAFRCLIVMERRS